MSEDLPEAIVADFSIEELDALLALATQQQQAATEPSNDPLLGYGDPYLVAPRIDTADRVLLGDARPPLVERRDEVRFTDVVDILSGLDEDDKDALAMEMYGAGIFTDIDDMFDENLERNEIVFNAVVEDTIKLAEVGTALGFETTFLKILMGSGDSDRSEFLKKLAAAKAEAAKEKQGGGRVIQWANPKALVRSLKDESKDELGRKASKREQRDFVKRIHNMQAKGLSVNVAAEAEAAARESAPVEAAAMDMTKARRAVMNVIMSRVGKG